MKINNVKLNCRTNNVITTDPQEYTLFVFRSAAMISSGGAERRCPAGYAVIFTGKQAPEIRPAENGSVKYEMIGFKPSVPDLQYAASMHVPYGTPVPVMDKVLVSNSLRTIKARIGTEEKYSLEIMEIAMRTILLTLYGEYFDDIREQQMQLPKLAQLNELRARIYDDPTKEWDTDKICRELCISRTYFHRLYLAAFGVTCRQDVIESRLIQAADLLAHTDMSVSSVAEKCGYESESYFMRQFRQHRGCTPSEFRKRCTEEKEPAAADENLLKTLKKRFT
ncbi:MAG: helix-turn-helix transcriptional regulator [Ruminococcus sp.]|nr:helix-turn-helix transcriptional regulator [Ruminococcus sp.]